MRHLCLPPPTHCHMTVESNHFILYNRWILFCACLMPTDQSGGTERHLTLFCFCWGGGNLKPIKTAQLWGKQNQQKTTSSYITVFFVVVFLKKRVVFARPLCKCVPFKCRILFCTRAYSYVEEVGKVFNKDDTRRPAELHPFSSASLLSRDAARPKIRESHIRSGVMSSTLLQESVGDRKSVV